MFFASLRDDEKSHFVRFSSESWKKYGRCFQPVCGEMDCYKFLFTVYGLGWGLYSNQNIGERAEKNSKRKIAKEKGEKGKL